VRIQLRNPAKLIRDVSDAYPMHCRDSESV